MPKTIDNKKMGVIVATAMSVTIVVGAGLLTLPGLSYAYAGRLGYWPWIIVAILMLPLLEIFSYFGRKNPSAGGVVGYVRASLGYRLATMCEMIILGTFTLGIPAIALIGAGYIQQFSSNLPVTDTALIIVSIAFLAGIIGLRISGTLQTMIALAIVLGLVSIGIGFLWNAPEIPLTPLTINAVGNTENQWNHITSAIPIILFAFTGWEMTAFLAEDMKNPQRDMPTSIWASFAIVTILYIFIAWIVATYALPDDRWKFAPIVELAKVWIGDNGARWVALITAMLVIANVIGAFISASRAIFSAGRDGLLPRFIGKIGKKGEPMRAMVLTYAILVAVILLTSSNLIKVDRLLQLAGQNFFVLYLLASIGYSHVNRESNKRWIGYFSTLSVLCMMTLFSVEGLLYCSVLAGLGIWLSRKPDAISKDNAIITPSVAPH